MQILDGLFVFRMKHSVVADALIRPLSLLHSAKVINAAVNVLLLGAVVLLGTLA